MTDKILIVDDDKAFLQIIAERMQKREIEVSTAECASVALKLLEEQSYDAVILDLMMPETGGIEAFKMMRERQPEIQVIFVSGHPSVCKGIEAMKDGAMDFIPKPIDINDLIEKIKQAKAKRIILTEKRLQKIKNIP